MVIIAAVDKSDRSVDVIEEAETLAEAFDSCVHIVHVLSRSEFIDLGRTTTDSSDQSIDKERVEEVAEDIASVAAENINIPSKSVGLMGDPPTKIINYANEQDAQYIVVAGRKRSPTGKAVFGSVTQSILLNADRPVLSTIR